MGTMTASRAKPRYLLCDALRGLALCAMIAFHLTWDLSYFGLVGPDITRSTGFHLTGHVIASVFLALSGMGLALAHDDCLDNAAFWRRLARISAAAGTISIATFFALPEGFIFFGILHCMALASLLALPLLHRPFWLALIAAAIVFASSLLVALPVLDTPVFWWLGLGTIVPQSLDYRPIFPWAGMVFLGLGLTWLHLARPKLLSFLAAWSLWQPKNAASRVLVLAGRHTLLVYLVHQPVLLGILWLGVALVPAINPMGEETAFANACISQCRRAEASPQACQARCQCLLGQLKQDGLWEKLRSGRASQSEQQSFSVLAQTCRTEQGN